MQIFCLGTFFGSNVPICLLSKPQTRCSPDGCNKIKKFLTTAYGLSKLLEKSLIIHEQNTKQVIAVKEDFFGQGEHKVEKGENFVSHKAP